MGSIILENANRIISQNVIEMKKSSAEAGVMSSIYNKRNNDGDLKG